MNCPRCKTPIERLSDPDGVTTCPGCGSKLMTRSAALRSQSGGARPASTPPSPATARAASPPATALPPSATLPPTAAALLADSLHTPVATRSPFASTVAAPGAAAVRVPAPASPAGLAELGAVARALESLRDELRALRDGQDRIVELLRHSPAASLAGRASDVGAEDDEPALSAIRAQNRKSVLLIDDDPRTRELAIAELQQADVPVRAFDDGNAALSAIAVEKPDVIVLELGLGGEMAGKDVINMIKATMEWVDVPIVLWTREPVSNQKEARQIHGADEIVLKSSGAAALVARVINVFRRG